MERESGYATVWRSRIHDKKGPFARSDIDVFLIAQSEQEAETKLK